MRKTYKERNMIMLDLDQVFIMVSYQIK